MGLIGFYSVTPADSKRQRLVHCPSYPAAALTNVSAHENDRFAMHALKAGRNAITAVKLPGHR